MKMPKFLALRLRIAHKLNLLGVLSLVAVVAVAALALSAERRVMMDDRIEATAGTAVRNDGGELGGRGCSGAAHTGALIQGADRRAAIIRVSCLRRPSKPPAP